MARIADSKERMFSLFEINLTIFLFLYSVNICHLQNEYCLFRAEQS